MTGIIIHNKEHDFFCATHVSGRFRATVLRGLPLVKLGLFWGGDIRTLLHNIGKGHRLLRNKEKPVVSGRNQITLDMKGRLRDLSFHGRP